MEKTERTLCGKCKSWLNMSMQHVMEHLDSCAGPRDVTPLPLQKSKAPALTDQEQDLVDRERMRCLGIVAECMTDDEPTKHDIVNQILHGEK